VDCKGFFLPVPGHSGRFFSFPSQLEGDFVVNHVRCLRFFLLDRNYFHCPLDCLSQFSHAAILFQVCEKFLPSPSRFVLFALRGPISGANSKPSVPRRGTRSPCFGHDFCSSPSHQSGCPELTIQLFNSSLVLRPFTSFPWTGVRSPGTWLFQIMDVALDVSTLRFQVS